MKFTSIQEIERKYEITIDKKYLYLDNYILDLFNGDTNIIIETSDSNIYYVNGVYYQTIENYNEMKKYYFMVIEQGYSNAMTDLGFYYQFVEKNYNEMKKYYLMAIEHGNSDAMNNLGFYYKNIEGNDDEMKKYYLMSIEQGNSMAMNNLGFYYENDEKNDDEMKKYYLMAIEFNNLNSMCRLEMNVSKVELYKLLINIKNKNELIQNKITELEKDSKIIKYNKIIEGDNTKESVVCCCVKKHVIFSCKKHIIFIRNV